MDGISGYEQVTVDGRTFSQITQVYIGQKDACCCGCCGTHYRADNGSDPDGEVKKKVWKAIVATDFRSTDFNNIAVEVGDKWYIAYFD